MPKRRVTEECEPDRAIYLECRDCGDTYQLEVGCMRQDCPRCAAQVTTRRLKTVRERLGLVKAPWNVNVLTVPSEHWGVMHGRVLAKARTVAAETLTGWILDRAGVDGRFMAGLEEATHPAGDEDPDEWKPHFNFLYPCLVLDVDQGEVRAFDKWASEERLADLRERWRVALGRVLGVELPVVDVYQSYRATRKKKAHALKYFFRTFPGWGHVGANRPRHFGFFSKRIWSPKKGKEKHAFTAIALLAGQRELEEKPVAGECPKCGGEQVVRFGVLRGRESRAPPGRKVWTYSA